jgi:hypothetical protein
VRRAERAAVQETGHTAAQEAGHAVTPRETA